MVNNIEWYERQLKFEGDWVTQIKGFSQSFFGSFKIGYELLIYNGILTYIGLLIISRKPHVG
jgi:hypothetical protein